jgi:hypothetical protein
MDNNEQNGEKLVQYLDGELSGQALRDFELQLKASPTMQAELENLQLAKQLIMHYGLKAQVAAEHGVMMDELKVKNIAGNTTKAYPFGRTILKIAAGLFIGMLAFAAWQYATVTPGSFVKDYYQPYTVSVERGAPSASAIETAYSNGDYKGTIAVFEKSTAPTVKDEFLTAQAYLAIKQPAHAVGAFTGVLKNKEVTTFKDDAEYYLAEAYLENGQPWMAKPLLEKIHNDADHLYHGKVTWWTMVKLNLLIWKTGE